MPITKITHIREGKKLIPIGFPVYYDNESNQYKVQMKCTECGDIVGCMCYDTLDDAAFNEDSLICNKIICFVTSNFDILFDEDMENCIPCIPLNECTQDELDELYDEYIESIDNEWMITEIMSRSKTPEDLSSSEIDILCDIIMEMDFESFGNNSTGAFCK
jgi:hypothetical protein